MRPIDIQINQAKIHSFGVTLRENNAPAVVAVVGLYSGMKEISTFSLTTETWHSGLQFSLPPGMIDPIVSIAGQLERVLVQACNEYLKLLPGDASE